MIVSGYSLELYCDYENAGHGHKVFPEVFFHELKRIAWKAARRAGWQFKNVDDVVMAKCPKCVAEKNKKLANNGAGF